MKELKLSHTQSCCVCNIAPDIPGPGQPPAALPAFMNEAGERAAQWSEGRKAEETHSLSAVAATDFLAPPSY